MKGKENSIPLSGGNEGGLYFVAITPSGHGLRIIAERNPGESIIDALLFFSEKTPHHEQKKRSKLKPTPFISHQTIQRISAIFS